MTPMFGFFKRKKQHDSQQEQNRENCQRDLLALMQGRGGAGRHGRFRRFFIRFPGT